MPPKRQASKPGVQTTLSKFFSSGPTNNLKKNKAVSRTDDDDDFEIIEVSSSNKRSKRHNANDEDSGSVSKPKKACIKQASISSKPVTSNTQTNSSSSKLKQFEVPDEELKANNGDQRMLASKNCPMISFYDNVEDDSSEVVDNGNEDVETDESILSSRLSAFSAPGSSKDKSSTNSKSSAISNKKSVKYTPLEQQVVDIKATRPDTLLCVECGYRYRFFGEDAEIAARVLKIFCHPDHNFMTASIPTHRLFVHLRRLVAAGYKVGVVKQTETAHLKAAGDNKSGPFTRKLTGLYTKSTLIGQDLEPSSKTDNHGSDNGSNLDDNSKRSQPLLCIYEQPTEETTSTCQIGIMCVDPASGDIVYDSFEEGLTCSYLETRINHLQPAEIIFSARASARIKNFVTSIASLSLTDDDRIRTEAVPADYFTEAMGTIDEFYQDASSLSFVKNLPKPTVSCLGGLCTYLKDFQLESILKLTSSFRRFSEQSHFMYLSGACLSNLEVFQNSTDGTTKGSLFWMLDHTKTKFGSRLLRRWLNQPLLSYDEIQSRLSAVEDLVAGVSPGLKSLCDLMGKLPDLEKGLCSIFYRKISPLEFRNITNALEKVRKSADVAGPASSPLLQSVISGISDCLDGVGSFSKNINEKAARDNDMANLFVDGLKSEYVAPVYETKEQISDVMSAMNDHRKEVRLALRQPGLNFTTVSQVEFLIEVKNTQLKSVPREWTQISSTKAVTRFHSPFLVEHYRKLNQLREQLTKNAQKAWDFYLGEFSSNFVTYKRAVTLLATLDCLVSLADVASQGSYCKPQLDKDRTHIEIKAGWHPIIGALSHAQNQFVPNDTHLYSDKSPRVMTVSGPNMGGKSSYIRQVALITIMAQIGSFVPAESASLGIFDAIHTRMGALDDIMKGRSTFMVELQEAAEIMAKVTDRSLVILDELGRGTSTHDGVAIAHATLKHFITQCKCLVMFVTHFPMMSKFQDVYPDIVSNFHMAFLLDEEESEDGVERLTFLYQLTEGAANRSYGLNVARLAEMPQELLQLAALKSKQLEMSLIDKRSNLNKFVNLYTREMGEVHTAVGSVTD